MDELIISKRPAPPTTKNWLSNLFITGNYGTVILALAALSE